MRRVPLTALCFWTIASIAAAQSQQQTQPPVLDAEPETPPGLQAEPEATPTLIPEIPAEHEDPMDREPDPAAGTPAAEGTPEPNAAPGRKEACEEMAADGTDDREDCPAQAMPGG